jgi:low temperature requirement protein LtrA
MTSGHDKLEETKVTSLELFFDLVFVFAITQVTSLLAADTSALGALRGLVVLASVWWAWVAYAWLTNAVHADRGGVRVALLVAMGARENAIASLRGGPSPSSVACAGRDRGSPSGSRETG